MCATLVFVCIMIAEHRRSSSIDAILTSFKVAVHIRDRGGSWGIELHLRSFWPARTYTGKIVRKQSSIRMFGVCHLIPYMASAIVGKLQAYSLVVALLRVCRFNTDGYTSYIIASSIQYFLGSTTFGRCCCCRNCSNFVPPISTVSSVSMDFDTTTRRTLLCSLPGS